MKNRNRSIFIMFLQNVYITVLDQIDFFCQKESKNTYTVFTNGSQILDPRKNLSRKILREFTVKSYILSLLFSTEYKWMGACKISLGFHQTCAILKTLRNHFASERSAIFGIALWGLERMLGCCKYHFLDASVG